MSDEVQLVEQCLFFWQHFVNVANACISLFQRVLNAKSSFPQWQCQWALFVCKEQVKQTVSNHLLIFAETKNSPCIQKWDKNVEFLWCVCWLSFIPMQFALTQCFVQMLAFILLCQICILSSVELYFAKIVECHAKPSCCIISMPTNDHFDFLKKLTVKACAKAKIRRMQNLHQFSFCC